MSYDEVVAKCMWVKVNAATYTHSWASWQTTGCSFDRWCSFCPPAQRQANTQNTACPHVGSLCLLACHRPGFQDLHIHPGRFLTSRRKEDALKWHMKQRDSYCSTVLSIKGNSNNIKISGYKKSGAFHTGWTVVKVRKEDQWRLWWRQASPGNPYSDALSHERNSRGWWLP